MRPLAADILTKTPWGALAVVVAADCTDDDTGARAAGVESDDDVTVTIVDLMREGRNVVITHF